MPLVRYGSDTKQGVNFVIMERKIKGIFIPIEVWENKELSWNEKILLMEIDSFTSRGEDCYFSNEYIASLLGVKENTASIILSKLVDKGYVKRTRFDGRHRYIESNIGFYFNAQSKAGFDENQRLGITEIKPDNNNTSNNNTPKKEYTLEEKRAIFRKACEPYVEKYGLKMIEDFCRYWCEADSKGVMACEKAKKKKGTFEVGGRLATWAGKEYNKPSITPQKPTTQPRRAKKTPWEEMGLSYEDYVKLNKGGLF